MNLNKHHRPLSGITRMADLKMRYFWDPKTPNHMVDYSDIDETQIRFVVKLMMDLGYRWLMSDMEGGQTQGRDVWLRDDAEKARASFPYYMETAQIIKSEVEEWEDEKRVPRGYIQWGQYNFPTFGRRAAQKRITLAEYNEMMEIHKPIIELQPILCSSHYMFDTLGVTDFRVHETACVLTAIAADVVDKDREKRWFCNVMPRVMQSNLPLDARDFGTVVDNCYQGSRKPTGVIFWDSMTRWDNSDMIPDTLLQEILG